jgi:TFIIF-interacting CTD phosphatase-like protein
MTFFSHCCRANHTLSPFLEEFLKESARYFEIYIYTMGSYTYAQKIVQIITEACHLGAGFFAHNRIVTRDHTKSKHSDNKYHGVWQCSNTLC